MAGYRRSFLTLRIGREMQRHKQRKMLKLVKCIEMGQLKDDSRKVLLVNTLLGNKKTISPG